MSARRTVAVRIARLLRKLTTLPTRSRPARELKTQLERLLMRTLVADGLRGVDRVIAALNAGERRLALVGKHCAGRKWREELAAGRTLEIDVIGGDVLRGTHVEYQVAWKLRLRPRHALQEAFYVGLRPAAP